MRGGEGSTLEQPVCLRPPERLYSSQGPSGARASSSVQGGGGGPGKEPKYYPVNPFRHSPFLKLLTKRQGPSTVRSKQWALKIIAEVYEARFQALKDPHWRRIRTASFVHDLLSRRYGVKSIVDKMCWELYQTLQRNRMEDRELDMFAWFLDELYDGDDLTFFVEARQKVMWANQLDKDDLVDMSAVPLSPDQLPQLVSAIFGNGAPALSDRVLDRARLELADKPSVGGFLDVALEEFRLHFDKPFPKIEEPEPTSNSKSAAPAQYNSGPAPSDSHAESSRAAPSEPRASRAPPAKIAPVAPAPEASRRLVDSTASEWQFPLIVELREQLVQKSQRIYELEEKLLVQGEGRAKVEQQLRQLRHQYNQLTRDMSSERDWVDKFMEEAGYPVTGGGDNASKLIQIFNKKNEEIEELHLQLQKADEKNRQMRQSMADQGKDQQALLRAQDANATLQAQIAELERELNDAQQDAAASRQAAQAAASAAPPAGVVASDVALASPSKQTPKRSAPVPSVPKASAATSMTPIATSPGGGAQGGGGWSMGPEDRNYKMLTQAIEVLERDKVISNEKEKDLVNALADLRSKYDQVDAQRTKVEETICLLEEERSSMKHNLDRAVGDKADLESSESNLYKKREDKLKQEHEEKLAQMKDQMSNVMQKVMKEWQRVKEASRKSVAVGEWMALEDDMNKLREENHTLTEQNMKLAAGGGGADAGPVGLPAVPEADPSVYGRTMGAVIHGVDEMWQALLHHGIDWRTKGDLASADPEVINNAVKVLREKYEKLLEVEVKVDSCMTVLVQKAGEGDIPDEAVDDLKKAIERGFMHLSQIKQEKALPADVQRFMDEVSSALEHLAEGLNASEEAYQEKWMAVLEGERDARLKLQHEYSGLLAKVRSLPESQRKFANIKPDY